jgi:predicted unusual protein kinase regulating ubiquinone biosynthesis (AarF/ABC1/UbiB family)
MTNQPASVTTSSSVQLVPLDRRRYLAIVRFFGGVTLNLIWWELVLRRLLGRQAAGRGRAERLRNYARSFRRLAVRLGGVMIKLGQFVSARVDVMPPAIIEELADLQDEVPAEEFSRMRPVFIEELGGPPETLFAEFDRNVSAAASLGQVYRARLHSGERVIVKIQRPDIRRLVATDLAALAQVARWTMWWPIIRKRADVPALLNEFAATLWQELDYIAEAEHAEAFQQLFEQDRRVYVPDIIHSLSTARVITLQDVTSIKITDYTALDAAGVDRKVVARHLLDIYLHMIFDVGFFHADPHPGNLFVYPLPPDAAAAMYDSRPPYPGTPFYVVFVDFGMVGRITEQVKSGLREMLVAVATRDSARMLAAYQQLGVLLPSADLSRIAEAGDEMMGQVWGRSVPELAQMPRSQMREFAFKYRDLLYEMPFQVPQDFIYLARAVGILSGICTGLDPDFNPWAPVAQYAQRYVAREAGPGLNLIGREALRIGQTAISLPNQLQDVLGRIQRGDLKAIVTADESLKRDLRRVEGAVQGLSRAVVFSSLLVCATLLTITGQQTAGLIGFGAAAAAWIVLALRQSR